MSTEPHERWLDLPGGRFRALEWAGAEPGVLFLHGLTGVAEAWQETVDALGEDRPRCVAIDQRGHGGSAHDGPYHVRQLVRDALAAARAAGLERPHLVGHSMGARVAMAAAAWHPRAWRSVVMADIGPEAWAANWRETVTSVDAMPETLTRDEAVAFFTRNRPTPPERVHGYLQRMRDASDGKLTWRGSREAWKAMVRLHRGRNYWAEWDALGVPPAMLVHGLRSNELRPAVAEEMRRRNPRVRYVAFDGIGHNIPLLAPVLLAETLREFWGAI
ncbi:MAG: alpha/beta fold hydrolase [Dehalococcoidia bacterium]